MLVVGVVVLAFLALAAWLLWRKHVARANALAEHRSLSRKIYGCLECGKEIVPPSHLLRCGVCREETTLHVACLHSNFARSHPHSAWCKDMVVLEKRWVVPSPLSLPNVVRTALAFWHERQLLQTVGDEQWLSYGDVELKVNSIAHCLLVELGLQQEDRVVLVSPSVPAFYLLQWACFRVGIVPVPINADSPSSHVSAIIKLAEPKLVFCTTGRVKEDECPCQFWSSEEKVMGISENPARLAVPSIDPDATAMLLPTSGTTGVPKLVIFTDSMMSRTATSVPKQGNEMVLLAYQNLRQAIDVLCKGGKIACLNWTPGNLEQLIR
jgi:hypothetical protein